MSAQVGSVRPAVSYAERARKAQSSSTTAPASAQDNMPTNENDTVKASNAATSSATAVGSTTSSFSPPVNATFASDNIWTVRTRQQQTPAFVELASIPSTSPAPTPSSITTSRSSSRKAKSRMDPPNLGDSSAWPEVGVSVHPPASRSDKEATESSAGVPTLKKDKPKWVQIPAAEMQAAFDANRSSKPQRSQPKSHSQTQSQSSASQSLAQSVRSSPHNGIRSRHLPDETQLGRSDGLPHLHNSLQNPLFVLQHIETLDQSSSQKPSFPRQRRPAPNKSQPVNGWTFSNEPGSPHYKPLFGSFDSRLDVNSSPKANSVVLGPSGDTADGPGASGERLIRQRGKVGIGFPGADDQSDSQSALGQDQDGWFVVDMNALGNGRAVAEKSPWEFGQFGGSRNDLRNKGGAGIGKSRRGSFGEGIGPGYRHNSVNSNGGRRGGRGQGRGGMPGNRGYSNRASISSGYRYPQLPPGYPPYDGVDPYAGPFPNDPFAPYYMGPTSPMYPPPFAPSYTAPYGGYPYPMGPPGTMFGPPGGLSGPSAVPPPIPMPITQPSFPLDPLRFYLLGQVEYYFSTQNLAADVFLRRQMDSEGWIPIGIIASFNRVQRLTQDMTLIRDTMSLSSFLEVVGDKVRLAHDWENFVLPSSVSSYPGSSSATYSLESTLSGMTLTDDDAASIEAKVTAAVLNTQSSMFKMAEAETDADKGPGEGEKDESSSNTTTGSLTTDTTPAVGTSPPSSLGSDEETDKPVLA